MKNNNEELEEEIIIINFFLIFPEFWGIHGFKSKRKCFNKVT